MAAHVFTWTEPTVSELKQRFAAGQSAMQIAVAIGCPSRSAVIGKLYRLGITRGKQPSVKAVAAKGSATTAKPPRPSILKPTHTLHPRNVARKSGEERREHFQAVADKALERFDASVVVSSEPVRFLDRGLFQCSMPQPGWDDAPVTEKMVCGQPVQIGTSWCPACLKIVAAPTALASFKHRRMVGGIAA